MELQYNIAFHMRCQVTLRSGRTITLESLDQQMTYAGLLEGTPVAMLNDGDIEYALRQAQRHCADGARPHLLPPPRRDYLREPGDMDQTVARSPHRIPEWLPVVRCIGSFKDGPTARQPGKDLSVLTLVWFQDEYAPPILEPALGQILAVDWDSLAVDIDI